MRNLVLFPDKPHGDVIEVIKKRRTFILNDYDQKMILGRHQEIFKCISYLTNQESNIIQIKGRKGMGKTAIIDYAVYYYLERSECAEKVVIDAEN